MSKSTVHNLLAATALVSACGALPGAAAQTNDTMPAAGSDAADPATGDERWIYVLRAKGLLQRFLIAQPVPPKKPDKRRDKGKLKDHGRKPEPEPEPLPEAQEVRLDKIASCLLITPDEGDPS
ncbi:MAG: hypothetical protein HC767_05230, partial [Akkermansiaceae bacterium]|nr:hypothetical protein [Akkermansiaceae bacterium]